MNKKLFSALVAAQAVTTIGALTWGIITNKKWREANKKLDKAIDAFANKELEIPEAIITKAVDKAVEKQYKVAVNEACKNSVDEVSADIRKKVTEHTKMVYNDLHQEIETTMRNKAQNWKFTDIEQKIISDARMEVTHRIKDDIDGIIDDYKKQARDIMKMYTSMLTNRPKDYISKDGFYISL